MQGRYLLKEIRRLNKEIWFSKDENKIKLKN